jgi:cytosine/adenosine deaminase-related metal-dependent hydrolase
VIAAGAAADLLLLVWERLDEDLLGTDLPPVGLVLARARARHIRELIVAGRSVVRDGVVLGIDHAGVTEELRGQLRVGLRGQETLRAALGHLECVLAREYGSPAWCC